MNWIKILQNSFIFFLTNFAVSSSILVIIEMSAQQGRILPSWNFIMRHGIFYFLISIILLTKVFVLSADDRIQNVLMVCLLGILFLWLAQFITEPARTAQNFSNALPGTFKRYAFFTLSGIGIGSLIIRFNLPDKFNEFLSSAVFKSLFTWVVIIFGAAILIVGIYLFVLGIKSTTQYGGMGILMGIVTGLIGIVIMVSVYFASPFVSGILISVIGVLIFRFYKTSFVDLPMNYALPAFCIVMAGAGLLLFSVK